MPGRNFYPALFMSARGRLKQALSARAFDDEVNLCSKSEWWASWRFNSIPAASITAICGRLNSVGLRLAGTGGLQIPAGVAELKGAQASVESVTQH